MRISLYGKKEHDFRPFNYEIRQYFPMMIVPLHKAEKKGTLLRSPFLFPYVLRPAIGRCSGIEPTMTLPLSASRVK